MPAAWDQRADVLPLESEVRGDESADVKKLRQLEDENRKLKHVVAELTLDNRALKDVISKNF
jgi:putative transposase